ncbi:MAG: hypothetical protein AAFR42_13625 [Cyanobacteria bacterium J06628_6]
MIDSLTFEIDGQAIVLALNDLDSTELEGAIARLNDHFQAAIEVGASLSWPDLDPPQSVTVDLVKLQQWLSERQNQAGEAFNLDPAELLNDFLSQLGVDISAFSISANGGFNIAFQVDLASAIESQDLSPEITQIISATDIGLGLCYRPAKGP